MDREYTVLSQGERAEMKMSLIQQHEVRSRYDGTAKHCNAANQTMPV